MAAGIIKGVGNLLGIGKKKTATTDTASAAAAPSGPIIKQLSSAAPVKKMMATRGRSSRLDTILSDKLGS